MKKLWLLLIIICVLIPISFATDDEIEQQEEILQEVTEKLEELDSLNRSYVNEKNEIIRKIRALEDGVRNTEAEINVLNVKIDENKIKVSEAEVELASAIETLNKTIDLLNERLRIMYMKGSIGYLEVVLASEDFEDLLTRVQMLKRIVESDTALIEQMEADKQVVDERKADLEAEQLKLVDLENQMQVKRQQLKDQIAEMTKKKKELEQDIAALEVEIDSANEDANKIKDVIKELKLREQYVGGEMQWPVPGYQGITSEFGMRLHPILKQMKLHTGIDIGGGNGQEIVAAQEGTVIWANWWSSYGKCIMIDHGGGIVTLYAHNSVIYVKKGQKVSQGEKIALSGTTGNVTGPHLHFEVRVNGEFVDPKPYVIGE